MAIKKHIRLLVMCGAGFLVGGTAAGLGITSFCKSGQTDSQVNENLELDTSTGETTSTPDDNSTQESDNNKPDQPNNDGENGGNGGITDNGDKVDKSKIYETIGQITLDSFNNSPKIKKRATGIVIYDINPIDKHTTVKLTYDDKNSYAILSYQQADWNSVVDNIINYDFDNLSQQQFTDFTKNLQQVYGTEVDIQNVKPLEHDKMRALLADKLDTTPDTVSYVAFYNTGYNLDDNNYDMNLKIITSIEEDDRYNYFQSYTSIKLSSENITAISNGTFFSDEFEKQNNGKTNIFDEVNFIECQAINIEPTKGMENLPHKKSSTLYVEGKIKEFEF